MEDRLGWVTGRVASICERLGVQPPEVVVKDTKLLGMRPDVLFLESEIHGFFNTVRLPWPELRISPEALENLSDRQMDHRLTSAILPHSRASRTAMNTTIWLFLAPIMVVWIGGYFTVKLLSWPAALVTLAAGLSFVLGMAGLISVTVLQGRAMQLRVIELTGDAETALEFLRNAPGEPAWVPAFFRCRSDESRRKLVAYVERKLRERGMIVG